MNEMNINKYDECNFRKEEVPAEKKEEGTELKDVDENTKA